MQEGRFPVQRLGTEPRVAEDIATGDTENTGTPETTPPVVDSTETPEETPAKPRKTRARKPKTQPADEPVATDVQSTSETEVAPQSTSIAPSADESVETQPIDESAVDASVSEVPVSESSDTTSAPTNTETTDVEAVVAAVTETPKAAPKKRTSTRKTPTKSTAADRKSPRKKAAPKTPSEEAEAKASSEHISENESSAPEEPTAIVDPPASAPLADENVVELTEATKRRRKPVSDETTDDNEDDEKPAPKRRTAANAKTAAPRTRKTIKPAAETEASPGTGSADETKPKRATKKTATKSTTKKAAPKSRTRKPKADESTVAVPDPSAPRIDDEPLVMDAKDAIAEAPKGRSKTQGDALADVVAEAEAALATAAQSMAGAETVLEGSPMPPRTNDEASGSENALGPERTLIAPTPPQPTIIERVPAPGNSKRLTLAVIFLVIGLIGLGAGYALGTATNDKSNSTDDPDPAPVAVNPNTPTTVTGSTIDPNVAQGAKSGDELFTLSGSNPRQSALFELPADAVTLHYDSTGGTFNAKLLPQSGGDGTSFDCSSACDKEQPIQAPAGSYYFDIQSSGGDWNIRVSR
jgi:hypothetical protein